MVYIPKGEHDNPHELPQQQELEGSTEIEETLNSHTLILSHWKQIYFKSSIIFINTFKIMKRYMSEIIT